MFKTTKEFSRLLKEVIGLPVEKECWLLVTYLYACFGVKLSFRNPASFTQPDITFLNKLVLGGEELVYTYSKDVADSSSLVFWKQVDFKNKQFMDVLLFGKNHVGVVLDDKYFIHAEHFVCIEKFSNNFKFIIPVKVYRLCR